LPIERGDIVFAEETLKHRAFHNVSPDVTTNAVRSRAWITFDEAVGSVRPLELSDQCCAFVDEERLLGFFVELD
jgi:hypothetical protein